MTYVKNLNGTGDLTCRCDSWLAHWENFTHKQALLCSAVGCIHPAEYGGHVIKQNNPDNSHYIIPLCPKCNKRADVFQTDAELVSANVQRTCG